MTNGHKDAQELFARLGQSKGFEVRRTYSQSLHSDGIWLVRDPIYPLKKIPMASIEVIVSESTKSMRGSIGILEEISPAVAIILLQEEEIRKRNIKNGVEYDSIENEINCRLQFIKEQTSKSTQRFEVWSMRYLRTLLLRHKKVNEETKTSFPRPNNAHPAR